MENRRSGTVRSGRERCGRDHSGWLRPAILVMLLLALQPVRPALAELVDRIVASVNYEVITLSELNQAVAFNNALGGEGGEAVREETLQGVINRHLLLQEAARLKFVDISAEDVSGEMEKLKKRLGSDRALDEFLTRVDINREQLGRMLAERLLVGRFIEKKIGLFVRVSRDEAEEYFNRNPDRFKGKSFSEVQKALTAGLQAQRVDEQLDRYLSELRSKADIRVNRE